MYQMQHRVLTNGSSSYLTITLALTPPRSHLTGTPLDRQFVNIAQLATQAGYAPVLFGYTDMSVDPRDTVSK